MVLVGTDHFHEILPAELRTLNALGRLRWIPTLDNPNHPDGCLAHAEWKQLDLFGDETDVQARIVGRD